MCISARTLNESFSGRVDSSQLTEFIASNLMSTPNVETPGTRYENVISISL